MFETELTPKNGFRLVNIAKAMKAYLLPRKDREGLEVGDFAELVFEVSVEAHVPVAERMWVEVMGVDAKKYSGFLRSAPDTRDMQEAVQWGDLIEFKPIHVAAIRKSKDETSERASRN